MSAISYFKTVTGYDLSNLLSKYETFLQLDYPKIVGYYTNKESYVPNLSFKNLEYLIIEFKRVSTLFELNNNQFSTLNFWNLFEIVEDTSLNLANIKVTDKFARSSKGRVGFFTSSTKQIIQKQNQSLEDIASSLGYSNSDDDWQTIATSNKVIEEDYTNEGGVSLQVEPQNSETIKVSVVVNSNLVDKELYGKDLNKKLTIVNDDLEVFSGDDVIEQSIYIYTDLKKGGNPEFPNDGIDDSITSGSNINSFRFPTIARQLSETFAKDDTFLGIEVTNAFIEQDNSFVEFNITDILSNNRTSLSF